MADLKNTTIDDSGFLQLPVGTTAERPASPETGQIRYNVDTKVVEQYDNNVGDWVSIGTIKTNASGGDSEVDVNIGGVDYRVHAFTSPGTSNFTVNKEGEVDVLVVAGGGGGGGTAGGNAASSGGGAGGLLFSSQLLSEQTYSIEVGEGSDGKGPSTDEQADQGGSSSAFGINSIGGGGGAGRRQTGGSGGSGGGGGSKVSTAGSGISGQGNDGGRSTGDASGENPAGGGGGAGQPGETVGALGKGGNGGAGLYFGNVFGTNFGENGYFAGGGGGGDGGQGGLGSGGIGGGGRGGTSKVDNAEEGQDGTGGGGGGGSHSSNPGKRGGNGIVLIRYKL